MEYSFFASLETQRAMGLAKNCFECWHSCNNAVHLLQKKSIIELGMHLVS